MERIEEGQLSFLRDVIQSKHTRQFLTCPENSGECMFCMSIGNLMEFNLTKPTRCTISCYTANTVFAKYIWM